VSSDGDPGETAAERQKRSELATSSRVALQDVFFSLERVPGEGWGLAQWNRFCKLQKNFDGLSSQKLTAHDLQVMYGASCGRDGPLSKKAFFAVIQHIARKLHLRTHVLVLALKKPEQNADHNHEMAKHNAGSRHGHTPPKDTTKDTHEDYLEDYKKVQRSKDQANRMMDEAFAKERAIVDRAHNDGYTAKEVITGKLETDLGFKKGQQPVTDPNEYVPVSGRGSVSMAGEVGVADMADKFGIGNTDIIEEMRKRAESDDFRSRMSDSIKYQAVEDAEVNAELQKRQAKYA
jgi:hypothetical protein